MSSTRRGILLAAALSLTIGHAAHAAEVVNIYNSPVGSFSVRAMSWPDYQDVRTMQTSYRQMAAYSPFEHVLAGGGSSGMVLGEAVDGGYFDLIAPGMALGRPLQPSDDRPGAAPVIVLGHAVWQAQFAGDPSIVGRTVALNGHPFEVVGIAPRRRLYKDQLWR